MTRRIVPQALGLLLAASVVLLVVTLALPAAQADNLVLDDPQAASGCPKVQRAGCCSCNIQKYKVTDPCNGGVTLSTFCGAPGDCCAFPCCF